MAVPDTTSRELIEPSAPGPPRRRPWETRTGTVVIGGVLVGAAVGLPLLRNGGRPADTLWAEDGQIYWQPAHDQGGLAVVLRGYAGYLQLAPRLIGIAIGLVPVRRLALAAALAGNLAGAGVAAFAYWATGATISSRLVRVALASLLVIGPILGPENTATFTNSIWVLAAVVPLALIAAYPSRAAVLAGVFVVLLGALSTPLAFVFVPLAVGRLALDRRQRRVWVLCGAFGLGLVLQVVAMITAPDSNVRPVYQMPTMADYARLTASRVFSVILFGTTGLERLWSNHGGTLAVGSTLAVLCIFVLLLPGAGRRAHVLAAALIATAVVSFVVPVRARGMVALHTTDGAPFTFVSARFSVVPVFLLAYAAALLIAPADLATSRRYGAPLRSAFVVVIVLTTISSFSVSSAREREPSWQHLVDVNAIKCASHRDASETFPYMFFPGFHVVVPCRELRPGRAG